MKKERTNQGITLIALVITIIILLILAGISIAMLTGQNGLLTKALKAKEEHLISQYKEEINLIIAEEVAERKTEIKEEPMIVSLEQKIRKKEWVNQEKVKQYNEEGITEEQAENNKYLFVESKEGYEFIIEVDNEKETAKITEANKTPKGEYTITYHPNGGTGEEIEKKIKAGFSIRLDACSYSKEKFKFAGWCEKTKPDSEALPYSAGSIYKPKGDVTLYATWESTVATITFDSNDGTGRTQTIEVAKGKDTKLPENEIEREGYELVQWNTKADGSGTAYEEGDMINTTEDITLYVVWEKQREAPEEWKITKQTDAEWYNYTNLSNNTTAKVNKPKLTGQMKPIKYIGETQTGSKWANVITMDGSMWVWIPRYAYKITSGYHSATAGTIEVAFLDTQDNFLNGETGEITRNTKEDGAGTTKWLVHPAFTSDASTGGGFGELEGLWVGKFEATGTSTNLSVKPGEQPLINITINQQYQLAKKSKFGENETINAHMVKNSEWGATLYIGHSQYGTNGKKVEHSSSTNYTGGSSEKKAIYISYKNRSTTYNATGVYDMNGGVYEWVASYVNNGFSALKTYGGTNSGDLYGANAKEAEESTAYKMVYEGSGTQSTDYETSRKYKGDAVWETSCSKYPSTSKDSWHKGPFSYPGKVGGIYSDIQPFFMRSSHRIWDTGSSFSLSGSNGSTIVTPNVGAEPGTRTVLAF